MADRESRKRKQRDYKAHTWRIYLNKPGYKVCFGKKKMAARRKEISRKTTVVSRPPHTHIGRFADGFYWENRSFSVPLELISCMGESREIH